MSDPVTLSAGAMLLRVVLALGLVLGLLAAVLYLYRRAAGRGRTSEKRNRIEVVAQRSLGPRTSLAIVEVAGESLLIGITSQQISALRTLGVPAETLGHGVAASPDAGETPAPVTIRSAAVRQSARTELPATAYAAFGGGAEAPFETTLRGEIHRVGRHLAAVLANGTERSGSSAQEEA